MLRFFDSLSKKKQAFKPLRRGKVAMYNCGPTVYDYVHIGNLRSFLFEDLLRRLLDARGYAVTQVMNITDVGHMLADADVGQDKMEVAAKKAGRTPQEVARFYTDAFFKDIERLGIRPASVYPKASDHVPEMIAMIERLLANGHAYKIQEAGGTSVYFDVASFPRYGELSGNTIENLEAGSRVEVREAKKSPADFALWISNPKHVMQWQAPWGAGYPGWHIECSAMARKYLGDTIDIHTGGEDNKFPHHECEIAQSECATGKKPFVRYWLHATHLLVDGQKMSKSKGNFYTLEDLVTKGYEPRVVRYALITTHYRQAFNFTLKGLAAARAALARLDEFADAIRAATPRETGRTAAAVAKARKAFMNALDDDLNAAAALAAAFDLVRQLNEKIAAGTLTKKEKTAAGAFLADAGDILGFAFGHAAPDREIPPSIMALIEKRDEARREKRFAESDRLRDELKEKGYLVEDTPEGRRIKRI